MLLLQLTAVGQLSSWPEKAIEGQMDRYGQEQRNRANLPNTVRCWNSHNDCLDNNEIYFIMIYFVAFIDFSWGLRAYLEA